MTSDGDAVQLGTTGAEQDANACLTCPMFVTTPEFPPQHREQRQQLLQIVSAAEARGQARVVEMNRQGASRPSPDGPAHRDGGPSPSWATRRTTQRPCAVSCGAADALAQIPGSSTAKILIRVDGAGATHGLLEHFEALNTTRRTSGYTVGWKITDADEQAIAQLPEAVWETSVHQDGSLQEGYFVAELTRLNTREGWPEGMRLIVRRVKPSRRHLKKLTAFEKKTGWRYCITATSIRHMWGIAGSGHSQFLDVLHRSHAGVEDRVRINKAAASGYQPGQGGEPEPVSGLTADRSGQLAARDRILVP